MGSVTKEHLSGAPIIPFFHTKKAAVLRDSCYIRILRERSSKSGLATVYLQININGEHTTLPLKVSWSVGFFDNDNGVFLERFKGDILAGDYNLEATMEAAKVNDIFIF